MKHVNSSASRTLHCKAKTARFCCQKHRDLTKGTRLARKPYGARESLNQEQVAHLFDIMLNKVGCAWAAVMLLISVCTGERVDAVRQICTTWLYGLDEKSVGQPSICWPDVNLKTSARDSVLDSGVAKLLRAWISTKPLSTHHGSQWPEPGHNVKHHLEARTACFLFPGRVRGGRNARNYDKAISCRAYNYIWKDCQHILQTEIKDSQKHGKQHAFDNIDLRRLSSHCGKKSCVNMLADEGNPVSIASALTATTPSVLQDSYISKPKPQAQRKAINSTMQDMVAGVKQTLDPSFCTKCGNKCKVDWAFCPKCGQRTTVSNNNP